MTFCDITLPPSFTSCTGDFAPQKPLIPAYSTKIRHPWLEYGASCMEIAKTVPPQPISDFLLNIILPLCPGHSMPKMLLTPAYSTQNRLPYFEYSASCMAITKTVPPRPISDFLLDIILPLSPGHPVPQRLSTPTYPTQNRLP